MIFLNFLLCVFMFFFRRFDIEFVKSKNKIVIINVNLRDIKVDYVFREICENNILIKVDDLLVVFFLYFFGFML